jgi:hypothetical protein
MGRDRLGSGELRIFVSLNVTITLPKPMTSGAKAKGRFGKQDFVYSVDEDVYRCPARERLTYRYTNEEDGKTLRRSTPLKPSSARSRASTKASMTRTGLLSSTQSSREPISPFLKSNCNLRALNTGSHPGTNQFLDGEETNEPSRVLMKTSDTLRPLGWLEHMFWLLDENRPFHFAMTALIAGKPRRLAERFRPRPKAPSHSVGLHRGKPGFRPSVPSAARRVHPTSGSRGTS